MSLPDQVCRGPHEAGNYPTEVMVHGVIAESPVAMQPTAAVPRSRLVPLARF
jgi:hypothetical protein